MFNWVWLSLQKHIGGLVLVEFMVVLPENDVVVLDKGLNVNKVQAQGLDTIIQKCFWCNITVFPVCSCPVHKTGRTQEVSFIGLCSCERWTLSKGLWVSCAAIPIWGLAGRMVSLSGIEVRFKLIYLVWGHYRLFWFHLLFVCKI